MWQLNSTWILVLLLTTISHLFTSCSCYTCNSGCEINDLFVDDNWCDCPDCDEEPNWTCATCTCPSDADCPNDFYQCGGGSSTFSTTPGIYVCNDGCPILDLYIDDDWCDCSSCEDESSWTCASCGDCPDDCNDFIPCGSLEPYTTTDSGTGGEVGITTTTLTETTVTPTGSASGVTTTGQGSGSKNSENETIFTQIGNLNKTSLALIIVGFVMVLILLCLLLSRTKCVRDKLSISSRRGYNYKGGDIADGLADVANGNATNSSYGLSSTADANNNGNASQSCLSVPQLVAGANSGAAGSINSNQAQMSQAQQIQLMQQMHQIQRLQLMQQQLAALQAQGQGQQGVQMSTLGTTNGMPMMVNGMPMSTNTFVNSYGFTQSVPGGAAGGEAGPGVSALPAQPIINMANVATPGMGQVDNNAAPAYGAGIPGDGDGNGDVDNDIAAPADGAPANATGAAIVGGISDKDVAEMNGVQIEDVPENDDNDMDNPFEEP